MNPKVYKYVRTKNKINFLDYCKADTTCVHVTLCQFYRGLAVVLGLFDFS